MRKAREAIASRALRMPGQGGFREALDFPGSRYIVFCRGNAIHREPQREAAHS